MSPKREIRYLHSLIVVLTIINKVKMELEEMERNVDNLKKLITEESQIDMFE